VSPNCARNTRRVPGPRVALAPDGAPRWVGRAIEEGGGTLVPPEEAEAVVWFAATTPEALPAVLERAPGARWVQLPWAGVEPYVDLLGDGRTWTCGKGVYAEPVAEHALGLAIAGLFYGGATGLPVSDAWSETFEAVKQGQTAVAVHSQQSDQVDDALDALRDTGATTLARFGADGKLQGG